MKKHCVPPILVLTMFVVAACGNRGETSTRDEAPFNVVAEGGFLSKGGQTTTGSYRIGRAGGDLRLSLSDDFETDEGPDLHIVLTPTEASVAENQNVMVDGARIVAPLASLSGSQTYDLPDDLDLQAFRSVAIHCIEFTHLYGAAALR